MHLDEHIALKRNIYEAYRKAFENISTVSLNPTGDNNSSPNYWLSCLLIDSNSKVNPVDIMVALEAENIESRPIWKPMHLQPVFKDCEFFAHNINEMSVGEDIFNRGICLPSDIKMTDADMEKIIIIVKNFL